LFYFLINEFDYNKKMQIPAINQGAALQSLVGDGSQKARRKICWRRFTKSQAENL